jgi:hypothetical protein
MFKGRTKLFMVLVNVSNNYICVNSTREDSKKSNRVVPFKEGETCHKPVISRKTCTSKCFA